MVKNFEPAVSRGFTSKPLHSLLICLAPPILNSKRNVIIREKELGGRLKFDDRQAA